jgi:Fe-S cluster biogenesis protein NfuA
MLRLSAALAVRLASPRLLARRAAAAPPFLSAAPLAAAAAAAAQLSSLASLAAPALRRPRPSSSSSSLSPSPLLRAPRGARALFVKIESTPNPDSLKFLPEGRVVLAERFGSGRQFESAAQAKGSKLVRRLLKIPQVSSVFLGRDFISVNKAEATPWAPLKPVVLDAIMDAFNELDSPRAVPLLEDDAEAGAEAAASADTRILPEDSEVVAMIKELLETRIRPAVQEDGGDIFYEGFDADSGIVRVRMAGSCVGCPSSTATLRNGVENMLMHYVPEVRGIEQVKGKIDEESDAAFASLEERLAQEKEGEAQA